MFHQLQKSKNMMLILQWDRSIIVTLPIREENIIYYAQRLVRRRIAIILRSHYRPSIMLQSIYYYHISLAKSYISANVLPTKYVVDTARYGFRQRDLAVWNNKIYDIIVREKNT